MQLKSLFIRRPESWEAKAQRYTGEICFDSPKGEIKLAIDEATATEILRLCARGVVSAAQETSNLILIDLLESVPSLTHEKE
jgi:hypothetical protein